MLRLAILPRHLLLLLVPSLAAPLTSCATAVTLGQTVIVLQEPNGYHERQRMEIHEAIHQRQYRAHGTVPLLLTYLLSPSRRLELEAEAYAAELCYLARVGDTRQLAWQAGFATALQRYSLLRRIQAKRAHAQLLRAYAGGASCERLLTLAGRRSVLAAYPSPAP